MDVVASVFNDRKSTLFESAPPIPAAVRQLLTSREPVRIFLRVSGFQTEPATFVLRDEPEHGSVRLLPQLSHEWAEVEYTPPKDRSVTSDSFKFAASNSKGTSSEATVQIQIKDIGPRLEVPQILDFGRLRVGQSSQAALALRNTGDEVAIGTLSVSGAWTLEESSPNYQLVPGQSQTFHLRLTPLSAGNLEGQVKFGSTPSRTTYLLAKVEEWIGAGPDPLELRLREDRSRATELILCNESGVTETVFLQSEPPLEHPFMVRIPPAQSFAIPINYRTQVPNEQVGKLILSSGDNRRRVLLWRVPPLGPVLGGLDSVNSIVVSSGGKRLPLWNEGGRTGKWVLQTSGPFKISAPTKTATNHLEITLAPGERLQPVLTFPGKMQAIAPGTLSVHQARHPLLAPGTLKSIVLTARRPQDIVSAEPRVPSPIPAPEGLPTQVPVRPRMPTVVPSQTPIPPPEPVAFVPSAILPANNRSKSATESPSAGTIQSIKNAFLPGVLLNGLTITDVTHHSAKLTFPAPKGIRPEQINAQLRDTEAASDGQLQSLWRDLPHTSHSTGADGKIVLLLEGLPPESTVAIRLLGPPLGSGRIALHQSDITTHSAPAWFSPKRPWIWALGSGAGLILVLGRTRRRF